MTLQHLPSIGEIEVFVAQLIALILLILAGVRLILHEWRSLHRKKRAPRQNLSKRHTEGPAP
jgi:hypothetical protein